MKARRQYRNELIAILALAGGAFFGLCLVSYDPADPAFNVAAHVKHVNNLGGVVGAYTADLLFMVFGISAYVLVGLLFLISILRFLGRQIAVEWRQSVGYGIALAAAASVMHLQFGMIHIGGQPIEAGGLLGGIVGGILAYYLNQPGAYLITVML
ncbi:MAG: DNA translocase FtsK 4TM domain-containing protein, partial [Deltaproteobacteria bacterium]|nr:DNA translocase FtsK 4TM domain-containing protein [Deltaproteobacteria bacterium]